MVTSGWRIRMLRYNFRDLVKANRLALSPQRIWIQFLGLVVAYLGYYALTFVSLMLASLQVKLQRSEHHAEPDANEQDG